MVNEDATSTIATGGPFMDRPSSYRRGRCGCGLAFPPRRLGWFPLISKFHLKFKGEKMKIAQLGAQRVVDGVGKSALFIDIVKNKILPKFHLSEHE